MAKSTAPSAASSALSPDEKKLARQKKKSESFKRLATNRVNKALTSLTGIASLANRNSYSYDQDQLNKIFTALNGAMKSVADAFTATPTSKGEGFTL